MDGGTVLDIDTLKTFLTLADVGNFTQTAQQLHVAQSTVSSRIKELETELGHTLFLREKRHLELTRAGESFLTHAAQMVKLHDTALSELSVMGDYTDTLRIGAVQTVYDCHLERRLVSFLKENPNVSVKVVLDHSGNLLNSLYDNILDLCFTYKQFHQADYENLPFQIDDILLVTGKDNREYRGGITIDQLRRVPLLYSDFIEACDADWFYWIFSRHPIHFLDIDVSVKLIPFLVQGLGYGFLPRSAVGRELERGDLVEIPILGTELLPLQSYVVYKKSAVKKHSVARWLAMNAPETGPSGPQRPDSRFGNPANCEKPQEKPVKSL